MTQLQLTRAASISQQLLALPEAQQVAIAQAVFDRLKYSLGNEGERYIQSILTGSTKTPRGNGTDLLVRYGITLEVKTARFKQGKFSFSGLESRTRKYDYLVCVGKYADGSYVLYLMRRAEVSEVAMTDKNGKEFLNVAFGSRADRTMDQYEVTPEYLSERFSKPL
jgi:hypothetical protein